MPSNFAIGKTKKEQQVYLAIGLLSIAVATASLPAYLVGLFNVGIVKIVQQITAILQVRWYET